MTIEELLAMARAGLIKEVEMKDDSTITVETSIPRFGAPWSKHIFSEQDDCYQPLLKLSNLKEPGDVFNMQTLAANKQSVLYSEYSDKKIES